MGYSSPFLMAYADFSLAAGFAFGAGWSYSFSIMVLRVLISSVGALAVASAVAARVSAAGWQ